MKLHRVNLNVAKRVSCGQLPGRYRDPTHASPANRHPDLTLGFHVGIMDLLSNRNELAGTSLLQHDAHSLAMVACWYSLCVLGQAAFTMQLCT